MVRGLSIAAERSKGSQGEAALADAIDRSRTGATNATEASDKPGSVEGPDRWRVLPFSVTLGLFVASGATGLIDQICFAKYLGYVVGATAHAVSAVLAAFMTGLALGAYLGGRVSPRIRRPLFAYGVLELVVALAVVATPFGFRALTPAYAALAGALPDSLATLSVVRWFLALLLVIVPTTAMGATLPFLSRRLEADYAEAGARGRRLGALYAANTVGGATGALLAAYALLPILGVSGTLFASAALSAGIGVVALALGRNERPLEVRAALGESENAALGESGRAEHGGSGEATGGNQVTLTREHLAPALQDRALLFGFAFASGALVFSSEVVFTHLLALIIGNSAYAFGLILTAFLVSLFTGASLSGPLRQRLGDSALPLGLAGTGVGLLGSLPLWDKLPALFASLGEAITSFEGREAVRGLMALSILFVPTTLMGLTFPLLLQRVGRYTNTGSWVGRLTATNTIGAVLGSLATGYLVLPALGSEYTLIAIGACFLVSALLAGAWAQPLWRRWTAALLAASLAIVLLTPRWDLAALTSGANVYFEGHEEKSQLVSIREDVHGGVTTVTEAKGVFTLYTNGKFQGNTGWEMNAQRLFAHYPSIFVDRFDQALVIGLGTGTTLGTLAAYPWQGLDVVEISPAIVEAARAHFRVPNRDALEDPRVKLTLADGRNYLLVRPKQYDLISMELSSIWFAGAANLYSDDFYRLVRSRLTSGGVFQQWVQLHHIRRRDFATIVHTLRKNFPHVALFYGGGQGILIASVETLRISRKRLEELERRPAVRATEPHGRPLSQLVEDILVVDAGLDAFLELIAKEAGEPVSTLVSTDDNRYLEYATPRGNVLPWSTRDTLVRDLVRFRDAGAIEALFVP